MAIPAPVFEQIASLYDVAPDQLHPLEGGHFSHVFEFQHMGRACVLRVTPPNVDVDLPAMRAILEWLAFLASRTAPVAGPVKSRGDRWIEVVPDGDRVYIAVAFEKAPGLLAETMSADDWNSALFEALGRTVGQCHRAAVDYAPPAVLLRPLWDASQNCFHPQAELIKAAPDVLEKYRQAQAAVRELPTPREAFGLCHMDLHFGNFFVDVPARRITLFDFDDCARGWFMMDIAMLLFDGLVVFNPPDRAAFGARLLTHLLRGYTTHMSVSAAQVCELPRFLKLVEIGVYIMIAEFYDPQNADDYARRFMEGRRERILNDTPYVELDFEAIFKEAVAGYAG